ncbi:MAG: hypothetical protein U9Q74_06705 [Gemmatimonadota bacterium]|nr:hypothetical protein [Gemmatimonadota bacterium]
MLRRIATLASFAMVSACAAVGYFRYSYPSRIAGTWVDSSLATPTDTIGWVLGVRGLDQTLAKHLVADSTDGGHWTEDISGYGYWYVPGGEPAADTGRICFRSRGRGRDACFRYQLGAERLGPDAQPRRRLLIVAYQGLHHTRDRILLER